MPCDPEQVLEGGLDPISTLIHGSSTGVDCVMVDRAILVSQGRVLGTQEDEVIETAKRAIKGIRQRRGTKAREHMGIKYT